MTRFQKYQTAVNKLDTIRFLGTVTRVRGMLVESHGPQAVVGELCQIQIKSTNKYIWAEVVGLFDKTVQLMPYTGIEGIELGSPVIATGSPLSVPVSQDMLGRILDGLGKPIDGKGALISSESYPTIAEPPGALKRRTITDPVVTGVRAIDAFTSVGMGQRMGIFSGSGVGKSTLLGMIARNTEADINVIALIGERGREVREFLEQDLGEEGLKRSVVIVSTSDSPPLSRIKGAYVATAVAEYFRDQGKNVMLLFDSVTRFARAQREVGLAIGEPPATRGFPPSVFSTLPKLLERCGAGEKGTITGFYTILVEGDDMDEPVSDTVRGILDGHIVLARRLAQQYHYPAIDVLQSVSRLAPKICDKQEIAASAYVRRLMALYQENEDLISVGAYSRGSSADIDESIDKMPKIRAFLQQQIEEHSHDYETWQGLAEVLNDKDEFSDLGKDMAPQEELEPSKVGSE